MFTPVLPPELAPPPGISHARTTADAPPLPPPAVAPPRAPARQPWARGPRLRRAAKIAAACALLLAGAAALLGQQAHVRSDNAVMSARLIVLRAPVEGVVAAPPPPFGTMLESGAPLARIDNPRAPDERLSDLRARLARLDADRAAAVAQAGALASLQQELRARAEAYRGMLAARLAAEIDAAEGVLADRVAHREQARRDFARRQALVGSAAALPAELDRARTALESAERSADSQVAALHALRIQQDAARMGLLADQSGNDVTYSAQRADEVAMRLADIAARIAAVAAERTETEHRLAAESAHQALVRAAAITAPARAMVWQSVAREGEHVAAGDVIAELVDCDAAILVASVPQRRVPELRAGGGARFRLAGERRDRTGRVSSIVGAAALTGDARLAAVPTVAGGETALALVTPDAAGGDADTDAGDGARICQVGRTADAVFSRGGAGLGARVLDSLF